MRTCACTAPKTTSKETVEVEVRNWDGHSFTLEGTNDQLEKLLKENKTIRTLAFRQRTNGSDYPRCQA